MRAIYHKACGTLVAHDLRESIHGVLRARDWRRADGTYPEPYTPINEECPVCHVRLAMENMKWEDVTTRPS